jgi:hypothetical protein
VLQFVDSIDIIGLILSHIIENVLAQEVLVKCFFEVANRKFEITDVLVNLTEGYGVIFQ